MIASNDIDLTEAQFARIADLVYRHCGITLGEGKIDLVRARLGKHIRAGGFATADCYIDHVLADATGRAFTTLIDTLSTNLTSFFREKDHFDYLRKVLLPRLITQKQRAGNNRLRVWCAAASTGEEPYSLAMTILEGVGGEQAGYDIKILASDISTRVLAKAREGIYDQQRAQAIPEPLRCKYMAVNRFEGRVFYNATPPLKQLIAFRQVNLMESWPFTGPFDFIFCRNVMIYFDKSTQQTLVNRFHDCLPAGGTLFTGHSESLTGIAHRFEYVQPAVYVKR